MKKQEFEELKERVQRKIPEICQGESRYAVYVLIGMITSSAGLPGERTFTESQLGELFDLATGMEKDMKKAPEELQPNQEQG